MEYWGGGGGGGGGPKGMLDPPLKLLGGLPPHPLPPPPSSYAYTEALVILLICYSIFGTGIADLEVPSGDIKMVICGKYIYLNKITKI